MQLFSKNQSVSVMIIRLLALILFLAATLALTSLIILTRSLSDAEAVNVSGSLRMQSYRLAFSIAQSMDDIPEKVELFELSLNHPSLTRLNNWDIPEQVRNDYRRIVWRWNRLRKTLDSGDYPRFSSEVKAYVDQIDRFVEHLQIYSEEKVVWLTIWQSLGFTLIFGIGYWIVRYIRKDIVTPIRGLIHTAKSIQRGHFDVSIESHQTNEMGVLSRSLQAMAQELGSLYNKLELKVAEKTQQLSRANDDLEFLYEAAQQLHQIHFLKQSITSTLGRLRRQHQLNLVTLKPTTGPAIVIGQSHGEPQAELLLESDHTALGTLTIEPKPQGPAPLIDSFVLLLSQALAHENRLLEQQKLLLSEERGVIARELHDSLAQSLSYLKIQCTLLERQLKTESQAARDISQDISLGLDGAYRQLRELLRTFRLPLGEGTLHESLEQMIEQLNQQHESAITLSFDAAPCTLNPNNLVHVIQIVREALLNAIKHAQATQIQVLCKKESERMVIDIVDNGIGLEYVKARDNHYGLQIIAERTERVAGELTYLDSPERGLTVRLTFKPN
jgi:two-component system nitrate/nitrite sensor histidine kinase NarQ